jgi:hypothetical protein
MVFVMVGEEDGAAGLGGGGVVPQHLKLHIRRAPRRRYHSLYRVVRRSARLDEREEGEEGEERGLGARNTATGTHVSMMTSPSLYDQTHVLMPKLKRPQRRPCLASVTRPPPPSKVAHLHAAVERLQLNGALQQLDRTLHEAVLTGATESVRGGQEVAVGVGGGGGGLRMRSSGKHVHDAAE